MSTQLVSVSQAAATALVGWLRNALPADYVVYDRWPEASVDLFTAALPGGADARVVVSVLKVGRRTRLDMLARCSPPIIVPAGTNLFQVTFTIGSYMQPLQLDVWAKYDVDRDDAIARLDSALNVGAPATGPSATDLDPVRDGLLLPLQAPFSGFVDIWLDEPEYLDSPDGAQTVEYRASYYGEARGEFKQTVVVPAMSSITLAQQLSQLATPPAGQLWNLATLTPNASPPPPGTVAYSTSSNP